MAENKTTTSEEKSLDQTLLTLYKKQIEYNKENFNNTIKDIKTELGHREQPNYKNESYYNYFKTKFVKNCKSLLSVVSSIIHTHEDIYETLCASVSETV